MKWPPLLAEIRIKGRRHGIWLWLPLFIIGPIVLVLALACFIIMAVFALFASLFAWQWYWWRPVIAGVPAFVRLLWSMRGLRVDVEDTDARVKVKFH